MQELRSYVGGRWVAGSGFAAIPVKPATEEPLARAAARASTSPRRSSIARRAGGPALRALSFASAARCSRQSPAQCRRSAMRCSSCRSPMAATRARTRKFDIDGAIGTLLAYAEIGTSLGSQKFLLDGVADDMRRARISRYSRSGEGEHVLRAQVAAVARRADESESAPSGVLPRRDSMTLATRRAGSRLA